MSRPFRVAEPHSFKLGRHFGVSTSGRSARWAVGISRWLGLCSEAVSRWNEIVGDALLAPSPHNTQPWHVAVLSDTEAELYAPRDRTLPHTDRDGAFQTATLGIFVEALDVAASFHGLTVEADCRYPNLGAGAAERPLFARLRLVPSERTPRFTRETLQRRRTARGAYDGREADERALEAMRSIAAESGHILRFTSDRKTVDWVVGLNADTLFYDLDEPATREEIGRWIRTSEREARRTGDGFSPRCLGFPGRLIDLFFFHHRLFASRPARAVLRRVFLHQTRGTRTVGWVQSPWSTPEEHYAAGRAFMRAWLELTRHELYLQPFGSVITNPRAHAQLTKRLAVDEEAVPVWLLLRVGACKTPSRSFRRPLGEVLS